MVAGDQAKAISKYADLEGLIKSMDLRTPKLDPPWSEVERIYAKILELFDLAQLFIPSFDARSNRERLGKYRDSARDALIVEDQQQYSEIIDSIKAFGESINKELAEKLVGKTDQDIPDDQEASMLITDVANRIDRLRLMAFGSGRPDLEKPLVEIRNKAKQMLPRIETEPKEVSRWCREKLNELDRYRQQLVGGLGDGVIIKDGVLGMSASSSPQDFSLEKGEKNKGGKK